MNNAEFNYLSSESVCRLFSIEEDKNLKFINGYEIRKDRLLKEIGKIIAGKNINLFNKRSFLSTDESVVKVKKTTINTSCDALYKINVLRLLSSKEVVSKKLSKEEMNKEIGKDKKIEIIISTANKELKITFDVLKDDLYKDAIEMIAEEINSSGFNLDAEVVYEKRKSLVYVNIEGESGEANDFNILLKGDEILKDMFTFKVISEASDYVYEIGGNKNHSLNKNIEIAKNIDATIMNLGACEIISTFDVEEVISDISNVVDKYNDLIDYFIINKNYSVVSKEIKRYQEVLNGILYELSVLGIDITLSSKLNIDKKRMKKKLFDDSDYARKYLIKDGGLLDKIMILLNTSNIDISHISKANGQKAIAMNIVGKVHGKTLSHEPYFVIVQNEKNDI